MRVAARPVGVRTARMRRLGFVGLVGVVLVAGSAAASACGSGRDGFDTFDGDGGAEGGEGGIGQDGSFGGPTPEAGLPAGETRDPETCEEAKTTKSYVGCDYWPTVTPNGVWSIFSYAAVVANTGKV